MVEKTEEKTLPDETRLITETPTAETHATEETIDVQLEKLKVQLSEASAKAEEKDKGFRTLQGRLTELQKESNEKEGMTSQIQDLKEQMKLMAAYVATSAGDDEESFSEPKKKEDLLLKFDQMEKKHKEELESKQILDKISSYEKRTKDTGLTENDEAYWEIEDLVTRGNFRRADIVLRKFENTKTKVNELVAGTGQSVEEKAKEMAEEISKEYLINKGYLSSDTGQNVGTTGGAFTGKQIGDMSYGEWVKEGKPRAKRE